jgi:hypothetical protein
MSFTPPPSSNMYFNTSDENWVLLQNLVSLPEKFGSPHTLTWHPNGIRSEIYYYCKSFYTTRIGL